MFRVLVEQFLNAIKQANRGLAWLAGEAKEYTRAVFRVLAEQFLNAIKQANRVLAWLAGEDEALLRIYQVVFSVSAVAVATYSVGRLAGLF